MFAWERDRFKYPSQLQLPRKHARNVRRKTGAKRDTPYEDSLTLTHLRMLEAESIHILREVVAEFQHPVMLYSIGKDSSVMVRLAQKAFYPGKIPFPLLHIDTTYKFREMIEFRDRFCAEIGANLIVHTNRTAIDAGANPFDLGTQKCCGLLKTRALLDALSAGGLMQRSAELVAMKKNPAPRNACIHSATLMDNGIQRTKGRNCGISSTRRLNPGESIRVFPLSNWTELDIWEYINVEQIPIVPLYFAKEREMIVRGRTSFPLKERSPFCPAKKSRWSCAACDRLVAVRAPVPFVLKPTPAQDH